MSLERLVPYRWRCDADGCDARSEVLYTEGKAPPLPDHWRSGKTVEFPDGLVKPLHYCPSCAGRKDHSLPKHARVRK